MDFPSEISHGNFIRKKVALTLRGMSMDMQQRRTVGCDFASRLMHAHPFARVLNATG